MRISYSRFSTYQTCPQRYKLQFVDRVPVPVAPAVHFGAAIHEALSFMYHPSHLRRPPVEEVVAVFVKAWASRGADAEERERQAYFEHGVDILRRHYERHPPQEERRTAATEKPFNIPLDGEHMIGGVIDRVDVLAGDRLEVIDYKTSRTMPDEREMALNAQMAIYRMAAEHLYPGREVTTTLIYLVHDYEMRLSQTDQFLAETRAQLRDAIVGIQLEDFDPRPGRHCDWCDYQRYCPLFREPQVPPGLEVDIAGLLAKYAELAEQERAAKAEREIVRQQIEDYLDAAGTETVDAGGFVAERRRIRKVTGWDAGHLRQVLDPLGLWDRVTQVSSAAVRELLAWPELSPAQRREIEAAARRSETSQLRIKRKGIPEDSEEREE
jgi:RecB family exonuclease